MAATSVRGGAKPKHGAAILVAIASVAIVGLVAAAIFFMQDDASANASASSTPEAETTAAPTSEPSSELTAAPEAEDPEPAPQLTATPEPRPVAGPVNVPPRPQPPPPPIGPKPEHPRPTGTISDLGY
jgi:outer membrane biosynthesis protein TonB